MRSLSASGTPGPRSDADMNEVSTRLQALQTQQQLGVQALSIANQNTQMAGVKLLAQALEGIDNAIADLEYEITSGHAQNEMVRLLDKVPGIGK